MASRKRTHEVVAAAAAGDEADNEYDELDIPTDAEAAILLLRQKLYPDPAVAAAAASAAKAARHAKRSKAAAGPSKATAAAIAAAAAAAAAAQQLPPIVLKTQIYTVLTDRTTADRDLEQLRLKGRVRVFKLAIGADEYVLLLADDFAAIINRLLQQQQAAAAQHQQQQQPEAGSHGSAESTDIAAALQAFRDSVLPAWHDMSIPRSTLLQLLRAHSMAPAGQGNQQPRSQLQQQPQQHSRGSKGQVAPAGATGGPAFERHLLALDLITRDNRCPDSYVFTVPGASAFVKSVLAGRQELLKQLSRKKFNEMLEQELICIKLRNSCLTPGFVLRDLHGRGLVSITDTTAGKLVRLTQRK